MRRFHSTVLNNANLLTYLKNPQKLHKFAKSFSAIETLNAETRTKMAQIYTFTNSWILDNLEYGSPDQFIEKSEVYSEYETYVRRHTDFTPLPYPDFSKNLKSCFPLVDNIIYMIFNA